MNKKSISNGLGLIFAAAVGGLAGNAVMGPDMGAQLGVAAGLCAAARFLPALKLHL